MNAPWKPNVFAGESRMDLSRQWMARPADERYLNLSDLLKSVKGRFESSSEERLAPKAIGIIANEDPADRHSLGVVLHDDLELALSNWTFAQIANLAAAPGAYLKTLPAQLVADNLNWGLRYNRKVDGIKTYATPHELRAVTGPDYGRIPDLEVVQAVMQVAGDGTGEQRWKIPGTLDWRTGIYDPRARVTIDSTTLYASDRDVFIFLVDDLNPIVIGKTKNGHDDIVFRGFYVQNSEVGARACKICTFYLRAVCCNRIMWGVEGFEEFVIRHTKMAPDRFLQTALPALRSFADGSVQKLKDGVEKAKAAKLASDDDDMKAFLKERRFSIKKAEAVMEAVEREEGRKARTAWDLAQGITAVARNEANTDDRLELELEAKRILDKVA
ncbi:DUF932 domain-containing protein [Bradyrhizobium sp. Leo121]|uniref:DUF932 domain-containing protein n=1 Tax=Bradyrhizobium sp. Leo121 TaxID=1571195 RepID=UPI00102A492F|nr:DUF932 domain-containing protein [Bradyrhizobium sp. Leo121]RZN30494.1 DUF932 domain-containing protein [Bradyrhizobium sp. Leo121]